MATPTALFRFRIELADIDRGVYEPLDFRVAQHPSETLPYLLSRVLAYTLNAQDGLAFSAAGLSEPDDPCMSMPNPRGGIALWIEIGNPPVRKLHKASKSSDKLRVYTYKNPDALIRDVAQEKVHRASDIDLFSFDSDFLSSLADLLDRENRWSVTHTDGSLTVNAGDRTVQGELHRHPLS